MRQPKMKQNRQQEASSRRSPAAGPSVILLLACSSLVLASVCITTAEQQATDQLPHQPASLVERQLLQLASHLSTGTSQLASALSLADIRRQLVGLQQPAAAAAGNQSLLVRQLDEYLLEGDYMKLFSAGFGRLMELATDYMPAGDASSSHKRGPTPANNVHRIKRATGDDTLNQTTSAAELQQGAESADSAVPLASGLPRPPTKQHQKGSSHNPAATGSHNQTAGKRRHRQQQPSMNAEQIDKSAGGGEQQLVEETTGPLREAQGAELSDDALLMQPEEGGELASSFAWPADSRTTRQHSAKLSMVQVPAPEQSSLQRATSGGEQAAQAVKSSSEPSLDNTNNNNILDNLDGSSLPDLSSILGQIQANADLENLEYLTNKQFTNNNNNNASAATKQQAWEPQLTLTALDPSMESVRSLHAPYVALDAGRGSGGAAGEFSVRQGALPEESGSPTRYSSQLGPVYGTGSSSSRQQLTGANLRLPAPLGTGANQRNRNQKGSASKKDNHLQPATQWTKINNNNNENPLATRRPAPEGPIYPDSIQQQLYGLTGIRGGSSRPHSASRAAYMSQQHAGASNHHPRIIPMNSYGPAAGEQAALVQGDELPAAGLSQQPASQVLGLLQVAAPMPAHHHQHQHQHQQQQQRLRRTARRASPLLLAATSPLESALRGAGQHGATLAAHGAHPGDYLHLYPAWPSAAPARYSAASSGKGSQRGYQHRIGHGEETAATIATTSTTDPMWTDTHQHDDDYQQSPQTIQITAVPNGLGLVGNGLAGLNGWGNGFAGGFNGFNGLNGWGGLAGGPWNGRQVLLVNKQPATVGSGLEWRSWLIPVAIILALPLVLGALFVPVFLKSVMFLIQILQMLGVLMPPSQLASHLLSGGSSHSQPSG